MTKENIQALSSAEKKKLRGLAMRLSAAVFVGKAGLSDTVKKELNTAFEKNELIKVKFAVPDKAVRTELLNKISEECSAQLCGSVGKTASFYKQNPNPEERIVEI